MRPQALALHKGLQSRRPLPSGERRRGSRSVAKEGASRLAFAALPCPHCRGVDESSGDYDARRALRRSDPGSVQGRHVVSRSRFVVASVPRKERGETPADGIFGVAMTVLVLDIKCNASRAAWRSHRDRSGRRSSKGLTLDSLHDRERLDSAVGRAPGPAARFGSNFMYERCALRFSPDIRARACRRSSRSRTSSRRSPHTRRRSWPPASRWGADRSFSSASAAPSTQSPWARTGS
jgi:hypothetical protein